MKRLTAKFIILMLIIIVVTTIGCVKLDLYKIIILAMLIDINLDTCEIKNSLKLK